MMNVHVELKKESLNECKWAINVVYNSVSGMQESMGYCNKCGDVGLKAATFSGKEAKVLKAF